MSELTRWQPVMTRWNPFKELEEMENASRPDGPLPCSSRGRDGSHDGFGMVAARRHHRGRKEYVIKVELPDVKKEDIKLTVENNVIGISGERKYEKEDRERSTIVSSERMGALCAASRCRTRPMVAGSMRNTKMGS